MKTKSYIFFITPALLILLVFSIVPILFAVVLSLTDADLSSISDFSKMNFIGVENYKTIFTDPLFIQALKNTLFYVIIGVPLIVVISLVIALGISAISGKLADFFKGVYYLPAITNTVAVAFVWLLMYNNSFGIINYVIGVFGIEPIDWLNDPSYVKISLIIFGIWKNLGLKMIIFLAGLVSIPKMYYEAASIDGAGKIKQFFSVTLPQLKFAIFFVVITTIIGWMQFFDEIYVLDIKETANANSLAIYIYNQGFVAPNNYGVGSAASIVLFSIILVITIFQLKMQRGKNDF